MEPVIDRDDGRGRLEQADALDVEARRLARFLSRLGRALLATGDSVVFVERVLRQVAIAQGAREVDVVAFPTVLIVQFDDGRDTRIEFSGRGGLALRFDQIAAVFALAQDAERRAVTPAEGLERLRDILEKPPLFGALLDVFGHVLVTVGLTLILKPTVSLLGVAALFGVVVGVLKYVVKPGNILHTLLPSVAAFVVAAMALLAATHGLPPIPFTVLVASLVTFLPGGMLAIAVMELANGDIVSGGTRFTAGLVQLMFLTLGLLAGAVMLGLHPAELLASVPDERVGAWAPWAGLAAFALGLTLHQSIPPASLPWLLAVLGVASAAESAASAAFGAAAGGFFGALAMTPVAYFIQYRLGGPPAVVTFPPGLWLLVPGSLGLSGLAELAFYNSAAGGQAFVAAIFTIASIALGALVGAGVYDALFDPIIRRAGIVASSMLARRDRS